MGFWVKVGKDLEVIINNDRNVYLYIKNYPNNYKYITLVKYVSDKGDVILNILILSRKQHLEKYFEENDLKNNVCLVVSDFGYSNNKIEV